VCTLENAYRARACTVCKSVKGTPSPSLASSSDAMDIEEQSGGAERKYDNDESKSGKRKKGARKPSKNSNKKLKSSSNSPSLSVFTSSSSPSTTPIHSPRNGKGGRKSSRPKPVINTSFAKSLLASFRVQHDSPIVSDTRYQRTPPSLNASSGSDSEDDIAVSDSHDEGSLSSSASESDEEKRESEHVRFFDMSTVTKDEAQSDLLSIQAQLHLSSAPEVIHGREKEHKKISSFLQQSISAKEGGALYLCGAPGTGKSLSVNRLLSNPAIVPPSAANTVYVNAMTLSKPNSLYPKLLSLLTGDSEVNVSPVEAADTLQSIFCPKSNPPARRKMT